LVNWDTQTEVWGRAFGPEVLRINPAECSLLVSEAPMCPPSIQDTLDEMVFEHFGFQSYFVDAGFSATHTVPIFGGKALNFATRRLNLGGKLLTNQMKTMISYRSFNVMQETHLINDIKVALDFSSDLASTRFKGKKNTLRREFVMPDYVKHTRGQIRDPGQIASVAQIACEGACNASSGLTDPPPPKKKQQEIAGDEQVLLLSNERIAIPELLHHPSDVGVEQAGIAECLVQSVEACVPDVREALFSNIVLTGGTTLLPNFKERLRMELRELVPFDMPICISHVAEPMLAAWCGGSLFAASYAYESQERARLSIWTAHGAQSCVVCHRLSPERNTRSMDMFSAVAVFCYSPGGLSRWLSFLCLPLSLAGSSRLHVSE